ncbi:MAG: maltokinase N-terminal cap-like domain-containing protein [Microbacteriaceae bacterium]
MPELLDVLADWVPRQRWYAHTGRIPRFVPVGAWALADPESLAEVTVHLLLDVSGAPTLYQVPVTSRRKPVDSLEQALIAALPTEEGSSRYLYDGPHDVAYTRALFQMIVQEGGSLEVEGSPGIAARGHREPGAGTMVVKASRVLSGEQSNSSIIFDFVDQGAGVRPVICKLFRVLSDGENPDVVLQSALGRIGSAHVPRSIGSVTGRWPDPSHPSGWAAGHLAFAQEFLQGAQDGWQVALRSAEAGKDFTAAAYALGEATAAVHLDLAAAMPSREVTRSDIEAFTGAFGRRLHTAIEEVPAIARHQGAIEAIYAATAATQWPGLQRIHGDFHLGQALATPERGWMLVDFEGEPLRPMAERSNLDVPLRDIAGMLRSFDYISGSYAQSHPGRNIDGWTVASRLAFTTGYSARSGYDLTAHEVLLHAFELDKALYELAYEARHRPSWLPIPAEAIRRMVAEWTAQR